MQNLLEVRSTLRASQVCTESIIQAVQTCGSVISILGFHAHCQMKRELECLSGLLLPQPGSEACHFYSQPLARNNYLALGRSKGCSWCNFWCAQDRKTSLLTSASDVYWSSSVNWCCLSTKEEVSLTKLPVCHPSSCSKVFHIHHHINMFPHWSLNLAKQIILAM